MLSRSKITMSSLDDFKHHRDTSIIVHTQLDIHSLSFVAGVILSLKVKNINEVEAAKIMTEVR